MKLGKADRYDAVVVGAGTAGAAAAGLLAERGLNVLCVERTPLDQAGARWINDVPTWTFAQAGLRLPEEPELRGGDEAVHLIAGMGPERLVIRNHGAIEVDMRLLVNRLQAQARSHGATLMGNVRVRGLRGHELDTDQGKVRARWFVDASGLAGARLLDQPSVPAEDLCSAAQEVRRVRDPAGARAFFAEHDVPLDEVLCFTAVAGGFSILNVRMTGDHVGILTGSIPALGHPGGAALLRAFVAEQPWIGERVFGGSRAIPLRRPHDVLARGPVALLGDAGCQVFSAHGSGIGMGLLAARELADALADGRGPHGYAVTWQRGHGGLLAAYDVFRRFSQTLRVPELEGLFRSGLMDATTTAYGMAQQLPPADPRLLVRKLPGLVRLQNPALVARLAITLGRMAAVRSLHARYPHDAARVPAWAQRVSRVMGEPPIRARPGR